MRGQGSGGGSAFIRSTSAMNVSSVSLGFASALERHSPGPAQVDAQVARELNFLFFVSERMPRSISGSTSTG
jgi:hypothetical protein